MPQKSSIRIKFSSLLNSLFLFAGLSGFAHADTEILPNSRHQQFQTYGLFFEEQTVMINRSGGRPWIALGNTIALLEKTNWKFRPQLVAHASANASLGIPKSGPLLTETIDARVGAAVDLTFTDDFRGQISWTHQSGHISDDVPDRQLIGVNLGNEIISFRGIRDIENRFRLGASFRTILGSDPSIKRVGGDQFAEWFPKGTSQNPKEFSPFLAAGLEQYGKNTVDFTGHIQAGVAAGNHFSAVKQTGVRAVLGYYNGADPRLKYFQIFDRKSHFVYLGLMFDI